MAAQEISDEEYELDPTESDLEEDAKTRTELRKEQKKHTGSGIPLNTPPPAVAGPGTLYAHMQEFDPRFGGMVEGNSRYFSMPLMATNSFGPAVDPINSLVPVNRLGVYDELHHRWRSYNEAANIIAAEVGAGLMPSYWGGRNIAMQNYRGPLEPPEMPTAKGLE